MKRHIGPAHGLICELDAEHGSGRIETDDGHFIYFHRNSLVGRRSKDLTTATEVRFTGQSGDLGPQASTVGVSS